MIQPTTVCIDCILYREFIKSMNQTEKFKLWKAACQDEFIDDCIKVLNDKREKTDRWNLILETGQVDVMNVVD